LSLLEHAIEATTFPGDIVMDCFAGSGSTAFAARNLGRHAVAMEIDSRWAKVIAERLELQSLPKFPAESKPQPQIRMGLMPIPQFALFREERAE